MPTTGGEATQLTPDTPEHRQVIDLAWLAIGRLLVQSHSGPWVVQPDGSFVYSDNMMRIPRIRMRGTTTLAEFARLVTWQR